MQQVYDHCGWHPYIDISRQFSPPYLISFSAFFSYTVITSALPICRPSLSTHRPLSFLVSVPTHPPASSLRFVLPNALRAISTAAPASDRTTLAVYISPTQRRGWSAQQGPQPGLHHGGRRCSCGMSVCHLCAKTVPVEIVPACCILLPSVHAHHSHPCAWYSSHYSEPTYTQSTHTLDWQRFPSHHQARNLPAHTIPAHVLIVQNARPGLLPLPTPGAAPSAVPRPPANPPAPGPALTGAGLINPPASTTAPKASTSSPVPLYSGPPPSVQTSAAGGTCCVDNL